MDEKQPLSHEIGEFKTDEATLNEVLNRYDLDESLEHEFNTIDAQFRKLEVLYTALLNTRRFLHNG